MSVANATVQTSPDRLALLTWMLSLLLVLICSSVARGSDFDAGEDEEEDSGWVLLRIVVEWARESVCVRWLTDLLSVCLFSFELSWLAADTGYRWRLTVFRHGLGVEFSYKENLSINRARQFFSFFFFHQTYLSCGDNMSLSMN